ncbi:hypothetical protein L810_7015 [Burkholderia sp. AU4i]|nr:hypothetical protein L810_7015 [Burkholderia sp. AU4i]
MVEYLQRVVPVMAGAIAEATVNAARRARVAVCPASSEAVP